MSGQWRLFQANRSWKNNQMDNCVNFFLKTFPFVILNLKKKVIGSNVIDWMTVWYSRKMYIVTLFTDD